MTIRLLILALLATLLAPVASWAGDVVAYDFAGTAPFIEDLTGNLHHALTTDATRVATDRGPALRLGANGSVRLPEGSVLFPQVPAAGYLEITVCPESDLAALPTDVWDGWVVLAFL